MNKLIPAFFLLLFNSYQSKSQNQLLPDALQSIGNEIKSIDPGNVNFKDLAFLKESVGQSRIILLGEQTHGEAPTFNAKIRLIKFFHEEMGFNVLAFESGLYDCNKIWDEVTKGKQLKEEVIGSLFYMYATSEQMYPLFDYMQKRVNTNNELKIAGFESQHSGKKSIEELFKNLYLFFDQHNISISFNDKALVERLSVSNFKSNTFLPAEEEQSTYFTLIRQWKELLKSKNIAGKTLVENSEFWYHVISSIESQAYRYWKMRGADFAANLSIRDKQMADNLIWLADNFYKNEKIIVWAHNVHIAKSTAGLQFADSNATNFFKKLTPMGNHIKAHYAENAYVLGFTGNKGSYEDYASGKVITIHEALTGSIEEQLKHKGKYYFIDFNKAQKSILLQNQRGRFVDFNENTAIWPNVFDGMLFINENFPVIRKQ